MIIMTINNKLNNYNNNYNNRNNKIMILLIEINNKIKLVKIKFKI